MAFPFHFPYCKQSRTGQWEGLGTRLAFLAKCSCSVCCSCSPLGKVQTTTSTYKYKMQVEEAMAPQELVQDLQDKQDGEEEEKKEEIGGFQD